MNAATRAANPSSGRRQGDGAAATGGVGAALFLGFTAFPQALQLKLENRHFLRQRNVVVA